LDKDHAFVGGEEGRRGCQGIWRVRYSFAERWRRSRTLRGPSVMEREACRRRAKMARRAKRLDIFVRYLITLGSSFTTI